jgi:hypothetical protein
LPDFEPGDYTVERPARRFGTLVKLTFGICVFALAEV